MRPGLKEPSLYETRGGSGSRLTMMDGNQGPPLLQGPVRSHTRPCPLIFGSKK